jgi:membrane protease YdiL (CAAX protease family)
MNSTPAFPSLGKAALLCGAVVVFQMLLAVPFEVGDLVLAEVLGRAPLHPTQHPLVMGLVNLVSLGAVLAWGAAWARAPLAELFPWKPIRWRLLAPILISTAGAIIVLSEADNLFRAVLPVPKWLEEFIRPLTQLDRHWISALLAFVLVAPLTEELLFRGLILRGFLARYPVRRAVLASALLFTLTHVNPWQFCSALAAGVLFAWWRVRTGSLWPGLIGHALLNSMVVLHRLLPLRVRGFNEGDPLGPTTLQPLWFDAAGVALLVGGVLLFRSLQPAPRKPEPAPEPPVIAVA